MGHELLEQIGEEAASQATGGLIGAGMGLLMEKHNDKRQIRQQQKLTDMQLAANQQMGLFNYEQQMKMWHDTNYSAQMAELKKAGLNPALLYGMSGGGGQTIGSTGGQNISTGHAPSGGGEIMGMMMNKAQIDLIKAQTANVQADTANKPKTGANIEASTQSITQGIENQQTQNALMKAQTAATNINAENTQTQTKVIEDQIQLLDRDVEISNATKEDKIRQIKAESVNSILTGESIKAKINVDNAQIEKMSQDIAQGWENVNINKFKAQIEANFKGIGQVAGNLIEQIFKAIDNARGHKNDQQPIKIK